MNNSARVSIIIPTYNSARWLGETLDSALAQTFRDIEILVFDNASTDRTPDLMCDYADPRLTYVRADRNVGFAGNVTRGIEAARGAYFMVLGSDDILEPTFIEVAVDLMDADPRAAMVHGGAIWIDDDGLPIGRFDGNWPARSTGDEAFIRTFTQGFCYSTVFARTSHIKSIGAMDETWGMISDTWQFLKLCLEGDILFIDEPLVRYRVRESSLSFELYADGKMFSDHLRGLEEAFAWPRARHLAPRKRAARAAVAKQAFDTMHMTRLGSGLGGTLRCMAAIVRQEPGVMLYSGAWLRAGAALAPVTILRLLRERRRRQALVRAGSAGR